MDAWKSMQKVFTQNQLMLNWLNQWFGFLGSPYERDCYLEIPTKLPLVESITPRKINMSPKKGPNFKRKVVFQPSFFGGELLVFGGVNYYTTIATRFV